jgi:hypothetical protein
MALQISQDLFSEPGVALSTALLVLGLIRWRSGRQSGPWLAGLGIGGGVLFRSDSLPLLGVGLLLLPAFVPLRRLQREPWALLGLALPIVAALAWTSWYAMLRDGTLIPKVYGGSFTTPLSKGLYGLLLSHGKSLFVFNPFLLLAIPGAVAFWRRDRAVTTLLAVLVIARVLMFARWTDWFGGVAWGPRFLMPTVVPLALLTVYAASRIPRLRPTLRVPAALATVILAIAGAVVSVASVWVWQGSSWNWSTYTPRGLSGQALQEFKTQRQNDYFYSFDNNAIAHNLRRMTQPSRYFPLQHFRGGPNLVGLLALAVAGLASLAAWLLGQERFPPPVASRSPPEQPGQRPRAPADTRRE